jgi:hypothetical protein
MFVCRRMGVHTQDLLLARLMDRRGFLMDLIIRVRWEFDIDLWSI